MSAEQFADLVSTKCLTEAGLKSAESRARLTSKTSPNLEEVKSEYEAALKRWESEAPVREAREQLRKAGWSKSQYNESIWYNSKTKAKKSLVEAIREAGLAK